MPRLMVYEQDSLETFALKLRGGYDWLGTARAAYQERKMAKISGAGRRSLPVRVCLSSSTGDGEYPKTRDFLALGYVQFALLR